MPLQRASAGRAGGAGSGSAVRTWGAFHRTDIGWERGHGFCRVRRGMSAGHGFERWYWLEMGWSTWDAICDGSGEMCLDAAGVGPDIRTPVVPIRDGNGYPKPEYPTGITR
jgi:hypothetical protein